MNILIGSDIVLDKTNIDLFESGCINTIIDKKVKDIIWNATYSIFNLEVPLTDSWAPIEKQGYHHYASTKCSYGLKKLGIDLFTLANNHIMDQNTQGLLSTINVLDQVGISHVGAGINIDSAAEPFYKDIDGRRYGIYACSEHEFSIASEGQPGANPFDPLYSLDHIQKMKEQSDFAIVLYHGGKEYYPYPSPRLQKICRKIVEKGADLVVCQHSHCVGCKEKYLDGTIIYGQGDFIAYHSGKTNNISILIIIGDNNELDFVPIIQEDGVVRLTDEKEKREILEAFNKRSEDIKTDKFVDYSYRDFAKENISSYLLFFTGLQTNLIFRIINKISGYRLQSIIAQRIKQKYKIRLRNYIECEAHRDLILEGLDRICKLDS